MNHTLKILLACILGLTLVCMIFGIGSYMALRSTGRALAVALDTPDGEAVTTISDSIAAYSLPDGFGQSFSTEVAGAVLVGYTGENRHSHIYLFQLPEDITVDPEVLYGQFGQAAGIHQEPVTDLQVVDQQPGQIAGQEVTLVVSEGQNFAGQPYRQVSALFQGRGGQALVQVSGPTAAWDQAEVDTFLASIQP